MARAEPAKDDKTCTKEYFMFATSGGTAGGLFKQTVPTWQLDCRYLYVFILTNTAPE
jgi:hypothetical protein